jgi:hypothetical protein
MSEPTGTAGPGPVPPERPRLQEFPETIPDRPEDPAGYKPLAPLALIGLAVGVTYGLYLLVCLAFSLTRNAPMPISGFLLLWPLAGLVLSAVAWFQVRRSEGTRAGGALAYWGMLLSLLLGLTHGTYLAASSLAINQQAEPRITEWFTSLKNDQPEDAFLLTLSPDVRPVREGKSREALHQELENRFLVGEGGRRGQLPEFLQNDLVKSLAQAGAEAVIVSEGVKDWNYENNGYMVRHQYRVTTPEAEYQVIVTAFGADPKAGQGRVWTIRFGESGIRTNSLQLTALGQKVAVMRQSAADFVEQWSKALLAGRAEEAYLATRPPGERGTLKAIAGRLDDLPGYKQFRQGDLVQVQPERFWAPGTLKQEVPEVMKKLFGQATLFGPPAAPGPDQFSVKWQRKNPPYRWSRSDDRVRVACDVELTCLAHPGGRSDGVGRYMVDAAVVVEGPASLLDSPPQDPNVWQVVGVQLRRAQGPPSPLSAPRPPG